MRYPDVLRFARDAAAGYPLRTGLSVLAMAIGVAAVVVLTALGDGARRYVVDQFSALGSNLVIVLPGRSATGGFSPANALTTTPRDLTIDDAFALGRLPLVRRVAPLAAGTSEISAMGRLREVVVAGTAAPYLDIRSFKMAQGRFLPEADWNRGAPVAVIGSKIQEEIFGNRPAVGELIRLGDRRLRVVGVLKSVGQGLGMNTDEVVFVPVSLAQSMFNTNTLFRILIEARSRDEIEAVKAEVSGGAEGAPRRRGGRHGDHPGCRAGHLRQAAARADRRRGRHRRDQPGRGRHPGDERDAGGGDPAHRRDRPAQGARRARHDHPQCLHGRGGDALAGRRADRLRPRPLRRLRPAPDVPGVPRLPAGLGGDRGAGHGTRHRPAVRHHAGARAARLDPVQALMKHCRMKTRLYCAGAGSEGGAFTPLMSPIGALRALPPSLLRCCVEAPHPPDSVMSAQVCGCKAQAYPAKDPAGGPSPAE
jgi:hypothetical protein